MNVYFHQIRFMHYLRCAFHISVLYRSAFQEKGYNNGREVRDHVDVLLAVSVPLNQR